MKKFQIFVILTLLSLSLHLPSLADSIQSNFIMIEGEDLYKKGDYDTAQAKFLEELKTNHKNRAAKVYLAQIYFKKGEYKKAANYYKSINSGFQKVYYISYYYDCAFCYYSAKEYRKATTELVTHYLAYKRHIKNPEKLVKAYTLLGDCYMKTDQKYMAINSYKKALKIDKNDFFSNKALGDIYYKNRKYDSALYYFLQANNTKKQSDVLKKIGMIYGRKNDGINARTYLIESLSLMPYDSQALGCLMAVNFAIESKNMTTNAPVNITPKSHAPASIHSLVETEGFPDKKNIAKLHTVIDLIWSDKEGKILLRKVLNNSLPICLSTGTENSHVNAPKLNITVDESIKNVPSRYVVPIAWDFLKISIKESDIEGKKSDQPEATSLYKPILVLVHELCHAAYRLEAYTGKSTKEEEFLCNMIGANVAHRISYDRPLNREETISQAQFYKFGVDNSSLYKTLEVNNPYFIPKLRAIGIEPPNYELYSKYYESTNKPKTAVPNLVPLLTNYFNAKPDLINKSYPEVAFIVDKNQNISNVVVIKSSGNSAYDGRYADAIEAASPIIGNYIYVDDFFTPVIFSLNDKMLIIGNPSLKK